MERKKARELIRKYLSGRCTQEEKALVESWYLHEAARQKDLPGEPDYAGLEEEIWTNLQERSVRVWKIRKKRWYRVAAVLAFILSGTAVYFLASREEPAVRQQVSRDDLPPGGNRATLTLSGGVKIALDDAGDGEIAEEEGITIRKAGEGQIVYEQDIPDARERGGDAYNTIETPRGGQYRVVLPDGTKVWLNAASSLRYPPRFTGNERRVELTGEGYFEVAPVAGSAFFVTTPTQEVEVLGTYFNIHAYEDEEAVKTTLLEGSLRVGLKSPGAAGAGSPTLLRPGQEARTGKGGDEINVSEVDPEEAIAWKNGLFRFENASLETVMRQLARWYDVEVEYEGEIPDEVFTGKIYRDIHASEALEILSYTGAKFSIEGKKIIISS